MEIEEFVQSLGIEKEVVFDKGKPTVFLDDSNEYAKMYSLLSSSEVVSLEPESVVVNTEITSMIFKCREFEITLSADLSRDIYKLTFEEIL